jgi:hypothetical protein
MIVLRLSSHRSHVSKIRFSSTEIPGGFLVGVIAAVGGEARCAYVSEGYNVFSTTNVKSSASTVVCRNWMTEA